MTDRRLTMDIHALLRRIQAGEKDRQIARALHMDRKTVAKYRAWAKANKLLDGPLPDLATLHRQLAESFEADSLPHVEHQSSVEAYRDEIVALQGRGLGPRLIFQKLSERPGFTGSESAVYRLASKVKPPKTPTAVGRIETAPGEVGQVDFGTVGYLLDPLTQLLRRAYVFVMVLGWSRHMFAEFVFDQKITTWLLCHQHAFEFFGGAPERVVLDNLKAAVVKAYTRDKDVEVQRAYAECAEHYGFLIDPCLPSTPQHKGKVERGGVGYIKQSFVPLLLPNMPLPEANQRLHTWLMSTAGRREHGTTHVAPLTRFFNTERMELLPLPTTPYDPAIWKHTKLHRDGHVVFEKAFYSAPSRFVGQTLWLRAGMQEIRLFSGEFELMATHPRATQPGQRLTQPDHLPPDKARGLLASREHCQVQAEAIGPATTQVIAELLASRPVDKLRTAVRVLHLAETYTPARLEAACARGLAFGDASLCALKHILAAELDQLALPVPAPATNELFAFARPAHELAEALGGGVTWN
jgi:transposase